MDSPLHKAVEKFNALGNNSFVAKAALPNEEKDLDIRIVKTKFRTSGSRTGAAIASLLGLTATPYYTYKNSNGQFIAGFFIFPLDYIKVKINYAPTTLTNGVDRFRTATQFSLFSNPTKRVNNLFGSIKNVIYTELIQFNIINKKNAQN